MPASLRSVGSSNSLAATSLTFSPTMPVGFAVGDLLVGFVTNGGGEVPATRPSGSTSVINLDVGTTMNLDVVRKVAVGSDVFTWTASVARKWAGGVVAIAGGTYDPVTPISGAVSLALAVAATTVPTGSSTPGNVSTLMLAAYGMQAANAWSSTDVNPLMVELVDTASSSTVACSLGVYASLWSPAMSSITRSAVSTISSINGGAVILFVNQATPVERGQRSPRPSETPNVAGPYITAQSMSRIF